MNEVQAGTKEFTNKDEYYRYSKERNRIILNNKIHRIKGGEILPVPIKPILKVEKVPVAYNKKTGTYEGRLNNPDECPADCKVKWENPKY